MTSAIGVGDASHIKKLKFSTQPNASVFEVFYAPKVFADVRADFAALRAC
jgi:hypothetical protein